MQESLKYELAHDLLARQIFNKFSAEEKNRRKAEILLTGNQEVDATLQKEGKRRLLTAEEIGYLGPYLGAIEIKPAQQQYLDESIEAIREAEEEETRALRKKLQQQRILLGAAMGVGLVMAAMAYFIQVNNSRLQRQVYDNHRSNAQRLISQDSLDQALLRLQAAAESAPDAEARQSSETAIAKLLERIGRYREFQQYMGSGDSLLSRKQYREAGAAFERALENGYKASQAQNKLQIAQAQSRIAFDSYKKKGLAYFDVNEFELALEWLEKAQALDSTDAQVQLRITQCKERL